jgi:hypothetical protein
VDFLSNAQSEMDIFGKRGSIFYFSLPITDESINQSSKKTKQYTDNDRGTLT